MNRALLLAFASTLVVSVFAEDKVIKGTSANFDELISKDELTLVKFFAPWCGHCKKMAGGFKEAAAELKGTANFVDLDATVEKELAKKYGIRGFPTLKLFSKGEVISDYKGGRTKDALIKYIERALVPSVEQCADASVVAAVVAKNKGMTVAFGVKLDKLSQEFKKLSMSLRDIMPDSIVFFSVENIADISGMAGEAVPEDSILLIRDDGSKAIFSDKPEGLEKWMKVNSIPAFKELKHENAPLYTGLNIPIFILFQEPGERDDKIVNDITDVAVENRGNGVVLFSWMNSELFGPFAEHVGVAGKKPPIAIYDFKWEISYVFNKDFDKSNLSAWIKRFIAGEVDPTGKSEPVPEKNDEPVKVVVGDSWKNIVEDTSKDVLIEQYAPGCGHCRKLAPIINGLATLFANVKTLSIAKMDATKNDAPEAYRARSYPTLHFFPAGEEQKGVSYDGDQTLEDLLKFLKENATHKEGIEIGESDGKKRDEDKADGEKVREKVKSGKEEL